MEPTQVLKVSVRFERSWSDKQEFLAQMSKNGRICVPKLMGELLKAARQDEDILGAVVIVRLCPFDADEADEED
jgi:hypothetical protein